MSYQKRILKFQMLLSEHNFGELHLILKHLTLWQHQHIKGVIILLYHKDLYTFVHLFNCTFTHAHIS